MALEGNLKRHKIIGFIDNDGLILRFEILKKIPGLTILFFVIMSFLLFSDRICMNRYYVLSFAL